MTVVGVDIDTWKVTLCALTEDGPVWETRPVRAKGTGLLDAILGTQHALVTGVAALTQRAGHLDEFHVERGRGMHRKADFELGAAYGAGLVALRRAAPNAHLAGIDVAEWKKAITAACGMTTSRGEPGIGNATKRIANDCARILLRQQGVVVSHLTEDELDAFSIAYTRGRPPDD